MKVRSTSPYVRRAIVDNRRNLLLNRFYNRDHHYHNPQRDSKHNTMNKAHQEKLAHEVNMTLIQIRQIEVNYFNDFFGNFGIQSGVLLAVLLANVGGLVGSNVSGAQDDSTGMDLVAGGIGSKVYPYLFFYGTSVSVVVGMHIMICCILCSVFGQGLALRGPIGSMVTAVSGMVEEQRSIINFFGILCISFTVSTIGMFGCVLDETNAACCATIMTLGMYMWYHYALRIYNRFYYNGFYHVDYDKENKNDGLEELSGLGGLDLLAKEMDKTTTKGSKKFTKNPLTNKEDFSDFDEGGNGTGSISPSTGKSSSPSTNTLFKVMVPLADGSEVNLGDNDVHSSKTKVVEGGYISGKCGIIVCIVCIVRRSPVCQDHLSLDTSTWLGRYDSSKTR